VLLCETKISEKQNNTRTGERFFAPTHPPMTAKRMTREAQATVGAKDFSPQQRSINDAKRKMTAKRMTREAQMTINDSEA
jgi:hypothetical protein